MDRVDFIAPTLKQSIECLKISEGKANCLEFMKQLEQVHAMLNEARHRIDAISTSPTEPAKESQSEQCTVRYLFFAILSKPVGPLMYSIEIS